MRLGSRDPEEFSIPQVEGNVWVRVWVGKFCNMSWSAIPALEGNVSVRVFLSLSMAT